MILKICYSDHDCVYINHVEGIQYRSNLSDVAPLYSYKAEAIACDCDPEYQEKIIYVDKTYLDAGIGCCAIGNEDDKYFLNKVIVNTSTGTQMWIAFTGRAYLCDDSGKTVDALR